MSIGTAANPAKVVLDTNIIISAVGFGGKPRKILQQILDKKIRATTSPVLLAELEDVVTKKFPELKNHFGRINKQIRKKFKVVSPQASVKIVKDEADNRVLEAAIEGECSFIVTGDKQLLDLGSFKGVKIVTAGQFLKVLGKT
ncbi:MAG: putative toxin-antitoxin system toxin component, PIN family [Candidatus Curtissbacteria bacterium]|nr:putative toxin-antitoxin system toxin component, PIN family [Candidatus Curtissbacteria bacterium]